MDGEAAWGCDTSPHAQSGTSPKGRHIYMVEIKQFCGYNEYMKERKDR